MPPTPPTDPPPKAGQLTRQVGLVAAIGLGLGSMVGAGVFVSLGLGAGLVGPAVLGAIVLAGGLAMCNGLSSAQLASAYPVSGGTYEYANRVGWPALGTVAGLMFLIAKSASAATAALGLAGYVLHRFDVPALIVPGALAVVVMLTVMVLEGIRRSSQVNTAIVGITFLGLIIFVAAAAGRVSFESLDPGAWSASEGGSAAGFTWPDFLFATALMFVAYTGYGRIATLGEEVHEPRRTIPKAIVATVLVCVVTYVAVAAVGVGTVGADRFAAMAESGAPLEAIALELGLPGAVAWAVTAAAVTALLGVILNLLLGLSRVTLAMARRRQLPRLFAKVDAAGQTPAPAVLGVAAIVAGLALIGSVRAAWSLSAVTVLIYYAITNASALRLAPQDRLYPRAFSWVGLLGCLGLAAFVDPWFWLWAGAAVGVALVWHAATRTRGDAALSQD
jgi:APA family basic amino acid/polyamine antiporter